MQDPLASIGFAIASTLASLAMEWGPHDTVENALLQEKIEKRLAGNPGHKVSPRREIKPGVQQHDNLKWFVVNDPVVYMFIYAMGAAAYALGAQWSRENPYVLVVSW